MINELLGQSATFHHIGCIITAVYVSVAHETISVAYQDFDNTMNCDPLAGLYLGRTRTIDSTRACNQH